MFSFQGIFEVCHKTPHSKIFLLCFFFKLIIWTFWGLQMFTGWLLRHRSTEEDSWGYIFTLIAFLYFILTNHQLEFLIQTILKCYSIFTQYIIKVSSPLIRVIKHAKFVSIALSLQLLSLSLCCMTYFSSLYLFTAKPMAVFHTVLNGDIFIIKVNDKRLFRSR